MLGTGLSIIVHSYGLHRCSVLVHSSITDSVV